MEHSMLAQLTIGERERLLKAAEARSMRKAIQSVPIAPTKSRESLPLSFAQQRLWFVAQMEGGSRAYHIPLWVRLHGRLDHAALKRALDRIVVRHEALRTTFVMLEGEPQQRIASVKESRFCLLEHDLRQYHDAQGELERMTAEEAGAGFDLQAGPLIRGRLIQLADAEHALLITMHHIVSDGWSMDVLFKELSALYAAYMRGDEDPLPELAVQYADYAVWQRKWIEGEVLGEQAEYWRKNLEGAPELLELPADRVRPARQDYAGGALPVMLNERLTARLKQLSARQGTTLYMTLLAAWAILLGRLSGQKDVVIGTPVANRGRVEIENLIGFFVNTLVVRVDLSGRLTVGELLARVKRQALAAQQHQDIPFEQVVELVQPVRSLAHSPLFQTMLGWQDAPGERPELPGLESGPLQFLPHLVSKFDMSLLLQESGGYIEGGVEYARALFEPKTVERYLGYFTRLLEGMVSAGERQAVDAVTLLGESEWRQVVHEWNQTEVSFPAEKCLHELFEEQVDRTPEAVAVVFEDISLSYGELNRRANRLGHYLRGLGVRPDARVAICVERGLEMIVNLLAVLKAGGAYVPLDPGHPEERLRFMVEDSGARVLLLQRHLRGLYSGLNAEISVLDLSDSPAWEAARETNLDRAEGLRAEHLAYVIYTSGSSGAPKGVMACHRGVTNVIQFSLDRLHVGSESRILQLASLTFDASVLEIFSSLLSGGQLWITGSGGRMSSREFAGLLHRGITTMALPPALLNTLPQSEKFPCLETIIVSGDTCSVKTAMNWSGGRRFLNAYAPTEATIYSTVWEGTRRLEEDMSLPVGGPIANTRVYILDREMQPAGVGVVGELYIGGAGVARGYLNRPELTAERFVPDPFLKEVGGRIYRTGDIGRWLGEGSVEFAGRNDNQVKIRGYRIELGEIEAHLMEHEAVTDAAVVVREDVAGDKRLVAYYTVAGDVNAEIGAEALHAHLAQKLPEYMAPGAFVRLDKLPLTANGKVDRERLPAPEDAYALRTYEAPEGELEATIARIWAEVLKVDRVHRHDNFFELGGHSLLVVQTTARLWQNLGVEVGVDAFFARPVLSDFAKGVETARKTRLPAITRAQRVGPMPLSFAQQRLWFLAQMEGASEAYHMPFGVRLHGKLDGGVLRRALDRIVIRHEPLRTTFIIVDGEPQQRIAAAEDSRFHLEEHDLSGLHGENHGKGVERGMALEGLMREEAGRKFDLENGPLIRGRLIRMGEEEHALLITMHHIVSDEWSMRVMVRELRALYAAFVRAEEDPLPKLSVQYADYAVWQRKWMQGEILQEQAEYWRKNLAGATDLLEVPGDHARPMQQDYQGAFEELVLEKKLTAGLKELSRRHGTTLYMTLLAGWAVLLGRLSGQPDVVTGTAVANRGRIEIEDLIGYFVSPLVLRVDVSGRPTVAEVLERVKSQSLAAQQHQDIPFEQVLEIAQPVRSLAHSPLFQVMFAWQSDPVDRLDLPGVEVRPLQEAPQVAAPFDLTLSLRETGEVIAGGVAYATSLYERSTMERYLGYLRRLLEGMVGDERAIVDCLPMLSEVECEQVLYRWNDTRVECPGDRCMHEEFEEQVEKTPEAVAVVFEAASLSYRDLNRRANRLAHYLVQTGVRPEERVGICVERGLEWMVGMLAVLKAGGVYVALDPKYPQDRLRYMAEDAKVCLVITTAAQKYGTSDERVRKLVLDDERQKEEIERQPEENPVKLISGESLAYVMYTSGSTGRPKGAMIHHGGMLNHLRAKVLSLDLSGSDVVAQNAPSSFDISVWQMLAALMVGGKVQIISDDTALDAAALLWTVERVGITVLETVPTMLAIMIGECQEGRAGKPGLSQLRWLISNAEALSVSLCREWFEAWPEVVLVNTYGATECSDDISHHDQDAIPEQQGGTIPLGRPLMNLHGYVLDGLAMPVPVGARGEIFIGGEGVGRGYWNGAALTAERFIPDPYSGRVGGRMYRTGDLGKWTRNQSLEFVGRADHQVKVRGHRIELGEIEARLAEHDGVREAVVLVREDAAGNKRLVAYYTGREGGAGNQEGRKGRIAVEELREYVEAGLPEYMVPAAYVWLENLPVTPNGKVDRKGLPEPEGDAFAVRAYVAPEGEIEGLLAETWAELLKVERVGRQDNFFELGGHSLLATRLVARIDQAIGVKIGIRLVFEFPQLSSLATQVRQAQFAEFDSEEFAQMMCDS